MNNSINLFLTGFLQIFLVTINTYFITHLMYIGVAVISFLISMTWSYNVKRAAFSSLRERIIYAMGCTIGGVIGLYISTNINFYI